MVPEDTQQQKKLPMDGATYMKHVHAFKRGFVCSICQGTTRVPVESPCDHVFCRECYDRLTNISATAAKGTSCPTCRTGWNHRPPATSALHQIALDTYMDFMKLHNKLAKLNGKKEEFVPESQILDFVFPAQPSVLTPPTKPIYYGLKTPRRPVLDTDGTPRPFAVVRADGSTNRDLPPRAQGNGTEPKERVGVQTRHSAEVRVASKKVQATTQPKETNDSGAQTDLEANKEVQTPALKVQSRRCQFPVVGHQSQQTTAYGTSDECVQTALVVSGVTQTPLSIFNGCDGETQTETPVQPEARTETTVVCDAWTESEAPAGRKRKANELEDTSVAVSDSSGEDLAEWRRRSGLDVVAAFEKRIPGFTDLIGNSQDVQQLVEHFNNSLIASRAHGSDTNAQNGEGPPAKKKRSGQEDGPEEANDDDSNLMDGQPDSLFDDTVNDAELIEAARDAERAIQEEREKQTRIESVVQDVHPVYPQIVSSPNVFDLFGHQADAAPGEEDDTDGHGTNGDGDPEAIDDQRLNVDSGASMQQVIVPETQDLFGDLDQNSGQELQQDNDYVPDSLEEDLFASSQQSPEHQPFVLAEQNAQATEVQPMVEQIEESMPLLHPSQMVICLSGIKENDDLVTKFKRFFGVSIVSRKIGSQVTHVVVQTNHECDMPLEHRTYKYFWGMAAKKYVVSHRWLIDSLRRKQILQEEGYEVRRDLVLSESSRPADYACRRARLQKSRIFAGYSFYPLSENAWMQTSFAQSLKYNQMLVLLEEAGARVVEHPSQLPDTVDSEQNPMSYILFPYRSADVEDMNREADRLSKHYGRQVMPADWVIDSIISNAVIQNERLDFLMPREARHMFSRVVRGGASTWTRLEIGSERLFANGVFSNVYSAQLLRPESCQVAIKKTWPAAGSHRDCREISILRHVDHPNCIKLLYYFSNLSDGQTVVNLVFEFLPTTVHEQERKYFKEGKQVPHLEVKLWVYQLLLAIAYLQSKGVCHRDIKPQNMLLVPESGVVKLGDFGSAKVLFEGEPNTTYQVTRYYRAPELILGYKNYGLEVDTWAAGCCFGQVLKAQILFPGKDNSDQLHCISLALGTPTYSQILAMCPNHPPIDMPVVGPTAWSALLPGAPDSALQLIGRLLVYDPQQRISALRACSHAYFDELHQEDKRLENGQPLPLNQDQLNVNFESHSRIPGSVQQLLGSASTTDVRISTNSMRASSH